VHTSLFLPNSLYPLPPHEVIDCGPSRTSEEQCECGPSRTSGTAVVHEFILSPFTEFPNTLFPFTMWLIAGLREPQAPRSCMNYHFPFNLIPYFPITQYRTSDTAVVQGFEISGPLPGPLRRRGRCMVWVCCMIFFSVCFWIFLGVP
jgi:hypothetical protein